MPKADEVGEVDINPADLRIDTYRASGAGGERINKTDPRNESPTCEPPSSSNARTTARSTNRAQATSVLAARLKILKSSRSMPPSRARARAYRHGKCSDRIRTCNFPQGRITDHRINLTLYKIDVMMDGDLTELFDALAAEHQAELPATLRRRGVMLGRLASPVSLTTSARDLGALGLNARRAWTRVLLAAFACNMARAWLIAHDTDPLTGRDRAIPDAADTQAVRRTGRRPHGRTGFVGRRFQVSPDVLIPWPDTELLIELAPAHAPGQAVEVLIGTGSGRIAITLALERPFARPRQWIVRCRAGDCPAQRRHSQRPCRSPEQRLVRNPYRATLRPHRRQPALHRRRRPSSNARRCTFQPQNALGVQTAAWGPAPAGSGGRAHLQPGGTLLLERGTTRLTWSRPCCSPRVFVMSKAGRICRASAV